MAAFSFEEAGSAQPTAPPPVVAPQAETPKAFSFDDATKPEAPAPTTAAENPGPMPGSFTALGQGIAAGAGDIGQTVTALSSVAPEPIKETSPAAAPFTWEDALEPIGKGLPKVAYRLGRSSPALAAGVAGGLAGAATPIPGGAIIGGAAGSAIGAAVQAVGPVFAEELKKTPRDPDGAWNRALEHAAVSGTFSGASWAAFPLRAFQGPMKQLAFQAFGVQPGIATAEQATQNVIAGKPITENLGQAYTEGAVGTAVPALGHAVVAGGLRTPRATPEAPLTPIQERAKTIADIRDAQADHLEQQANLPGATDAQKQAFNSAANLLRDEANERLFFANQAPIPETKGKIAKSWVDNFQPELTSDKALQIEPLFSRFKSSVAQVRDSIITRSQDSYYRWNKVPQEARDRFLEAYETGQRMPPDLLREYPWMQTEAAKYQKYLKQAYIDEKHYGSSSDFFENYFPHLWNDPIAARGIFQNANLPQVMGPRWFQKARYYDLIKYGKDNGLTLRSENPEELVTMRLMSGADMRAKMGLLEDLYRNGVAVPSDRAPADILNPPRGNPFPWQEVTAPNGKSWRIAPDAQALWENGVKAKGLWANEGVPGSLFKKWMTLKNAWVPIKLGVSLFHPVHVAHISLNNNVARALHETFGRGEPGTSNRLTAIPRALLNSASDMAHLPLTLIENVFRVPVTFHAGKEIRQAWTTHPDEQTPRQQALVKMVNESGTSAQLSEQLRIAAQRDFRNAIDNNQYLKALLPGTRRALEKLSGWIFEKWIPDLKMAAVAREAESLFKRHPELIDNEPKRLVAMRAIGKQVDNRFGEMFYGSLFWNRTMKDAAIGSFLSLGWNLGFAREFIGGALEPAARRLMDAPTPTRQLIRDTTNKSTNAFIYMMSAMTANALITKSMTGEDPKDMDYIFPRIGGNNPDGTPRRQSNPYYTREIPMAAKNIQEQNGVIAGLAQMAYHKMMFAPFIEMGTNKDYFGYQIRDENAPAWKQIQQFGTHILTEQLNPMSIAGAKRSLQLSGKPYSFGDVVSEAIKQRSPMPLIEAAKGITDPDVYMPIMGFGPAPGYASKTSIQNHIAHSFGKYVAPEAKPFGMRENAMERREARDSYLLARQGKDPEAIAKAAKKMTDLGVKPASITKLQPGTGDIYMFSRIPDAEQKNILKEASKDEFKRYYPKANKKAKADPEIRLLQQFYYRN